MSLSPTASEVRVCIVKRDEKGYGLTVHGTKPVVVQSVRAEGAAWKAGIRERDEILEVNGRSVEDMNHADVVKLIKERNVVEFKVVAGLTCTRQRNGAASQQSHARKSRQAARQTITTTSTTVLQVVSEPRPVDPEKFREISQMSSDTARRMLASAIDMRQDLQTQLDAQPDNADLRQRLSKAQHQVELLTRMLDESGPQPAVRASVTVSSATPSAVGVVSPSLSTASPSPLSSSSPSAASLQAWSAAPSLSAPAPSSSPLSPRPWVAVAQGASLPRLAEPPSDESELPLTHSKSCSMPEQAQSPGVRPPTRSKSDSQEKNRPKSMDVSALLSSASSNSTRQHHHKSTSQPQEIDSIGEDSSPTPEPGAAKHRRTNSDEIFGPTVTSSEPPKMTPISIDDPEMDEDSDEATAIDAEIEMFAEFEEVLNRPARFAKLLSYAYKNSKTPHGQLSFYRLLFIIVMRDYTSCLEHKDKGDFIKDLRRIVYEIYSTFVASGSPLDVVVEERTCFEISERMRDEEEASRVNYLKYMLKPAFDDTMRSCTILKDFQIALRQGLDTVLSGAALRRHMSREDEVKSLESSLSNLLSEVPRWEETPRRAAILSAISTILKHFQSAEERAPYRSVENMALMSAAPFNSKLSKSRSSMLPNLRRHKTAHNGHSLVHKVIDVEAFCDHCGLIICGTAPQAEVCHHCSAHLHKECRPAYKKNCDRSKRTSLFGPFSRGDRKSKEASTAADGQKIRKMGSREGSAEQSLGPAVSPGSDARVQRHNSVRGVPGMVGRAVEEWNRSSAIGVDDDQASPQPSTPRESAEGSLGRSESLKAPSSRPNVNSWRNKSDCSQHGEAISEAEMQLGLSLDNLPQNLTPSSSGMSLPTPQEPEVKEADVRARLEAEPMMSGLPADVQRFMQDFGFRTYYDQLSSSNNRNLKDYQIACCEMYFQELSHIRNLKVMQYMFVDNWPSAAEDLKMAMGLDKLQSLIQMREDLVELLQLRMDREQPKKFNNMGLAYTEWLDLSRSISLKCHLGCIRYKGENHFDKLLQERYKRVGPWIERTYNKLSLFDLMISVNQHACRPSLHLNSVKKSLMKLLKQDKNKYAQELEVWKAAEMKLNDVAQYLNNLKKKVVDLIPKIEATKMQNSFAQRIVPQAWRELPRSLNTFYFIHDAKCSVRVATDGKSKEARLLVFDSFLIFLYIDPNIPDRFVVRPWEGIPAPVEWSLLTHVTVDRTMKNGGVMMLLDQSTDSPGQSKSRGLMVSVLLTEDASRQTEVRKLITVMEEQMKRHPSTLRQSRLMGSSMSLSYGPRTNRSGSTVSTQSAMTIMQSSSDGDAARRLSPRASIDEGSPTSELEAAPGSDEARGEALRQDSAETVVAARQRSASCQSADEATMALSEANRRLLVAVRQHRHSLMEQLTVTHVQYREVVDVMETDGAKDATDLLLVLLNQFGQFAELMAELASGGDQTAVVHDAQIERLKKFSSGLNARLHCYAQARNEAEGGPASEPEETLAESKYNSVFSPAPPDDGDSDEETKNLDECEEEEEEAEARGSQGADEADGNAGDDVEEGPVAMQEDEDTTKEQSSDDEGEDFDAEEANVTETDVEEKVIDIARSLVQKAFQVAMQRVISEHRDTRISEEDEEEEEATVAEEEEEEEKD